MTARCVRGAHRAAGPTIPLPIILGVPVRHHRPDYISPDAPYVQIRRATYVPVDPWDDNELPEVGKPINRWDVSWRSVVYLAGVLAALGLLLSMFAYGVIQIAKLSAPPADGSTWVVPTTYGPPQVGPQPPAQTYRAGIVVRR